MPDVGLSNVLSDGELVSRGRLTETGIEPETISYLQIAPHVPEYMDKVLDVLVHALAYVHDRPHRSEPCKTKG